MGKGSRSGKDLMVVEDKLPNSYLRWFFVSCRCHEVELTKQPQPSTTF